MTILYHTAPVVLSLEIKIFFYFTTFLGHLKSLIRCGRVFSYFIVCRTDLRLAQRIKKKSHLVLVGTKCF